jgi:SAM-dependent methyltransferase
MSCDGTARVATIYSADAAAYESLWAPVLRPLGEELIGALAIARARRILDAGTGVGSLLPVLHAASPGALVVGVDAAVGMLRRAPPAFPRAAMDLRRLAFADEAFDAVTALFVLFHVQPPGPAVAELRRVLRPGGILGATTWTSAPRLGAQIVWDEELERHGAPPARPDFLDHEPLSSAAKVSALFAAEGLVVVRAWERPFDHVYTPETFLALRTSLGTSGQRVSALSAERRQAVVDAARRRFAALGPDDFVDRTHVVFTIAVR